jgi:hypothetical protein
MQQATYNNALQQLERSETEYKTDTQAVGDTEKLIEKKQKQLAEEKLKAEVSRKNYLDAKQKLERAQTALDNAWKN